LQPAHRLGAASAPHAWHGIVPTLCCCCCGVVSDCEALSFFLLPQITIYLLLIFCGFSFVSGFYSCLQIKLICLGCMLACRKQRVYACMHVCMSYVCKPFEAKLLSTAIMVDCDYDDTRVHVFCIVTRCPECTPDLLPNKSSLWSSMSY